MFSVALMATLACTIGFAQSAQAGLTIDLNFTSVNGAALPTATNVVTASPGDTLVMEVSYSTDVRLVISQFSVQYDNAVDNLSVVRATQWTGYTYGMGGANTFGPVFTSPTDDGSSIKSWESSAPAGGSATIPGAPYVVGTVVWIVGSPTIDGEDIFSGLFSGSDGIFENGGAAVATQFGNATVNAIPEPGTASLLGLGLVGLILAGRRSRA